MNNLVEDRLTRHFPHVVATGIDHSTAAWPHYVRADGRQLPFDDGAFDLVYANAVIEHVGSETDQRRFVAEVARVGRAWIITTPNRYFPVEAHYHTLLTHWRRKWSPPDSSLRLLGLRDLRSLLPYGELRGLPVLSPTITAVGIAEASRPQDEARN